MKNSLKRLLSLLLVFVLVLGMFPTAMAAENDGSTDETEPSSTETTGDGNAGGLPEAWQIISDNLPDAIEGYDPNDPDNPYPYGVPVDTFYPEEDIDPYAMSLMALDQSYIPEEMWDSTILRALEYTGYDVQYLKDNGYLYVRQYTSSNILNYAPSVLSDIGYWSSGACPNGDETITDSSTVSGKAPKISYFESNGLVCASFVTYFLCNYLPNIEGVDTSVVYDKAKELGADANYDNVYYLTTVNLWKRTLDALATQGDAGVTKYTDADTAYANLVPGDVIVFSADGDLKHVAIYAGTCDFYSTSGTNGGKYHFIIHVGNSRGPEISTVEYMGSAGSKSSYPSAWYHLDFNDIVDATGFIEVNKSTPDGTALAGAYFVATNQSTNEQHIIGPTDANGYAKSGELPLGTYKVVETVFPDGYTTSGTSEWTVELTEDTPNMTITIDAENQLITGQAKIVKATTNGGTKAGWNFKVEDADGNLIGNYTTDATGEIVLDLVPGTYTVTETDGAYKYWVNDPEPTKTVTVEAGETATVTFTNQWRGQAQIIKTATNGGSVEGWHFEVKDADGNVVGNYTTDATGIITIDLEPGTYTVTETDGAYKYWVNDPTPSKTVTVKAGETAKVTFTNQWRGQAQIVKTATNGGSVEGWHFEVKDADGNVVGNYTTDSIGIITIDLEPGTYTVTETDGAYKYWVNDPTPSKTVTVKAGETAKVTFKNQYRGQAQIVKTATNGGSVAGWHFEVKDADGNLIGNYTTDSTGIITIDLEPGTYTVTETDGKYEYWHNDPTPSRTVTVKAGETAKVTFQNEWIGKAKIIKTATNGGTVEGWQFTIKDSTGATVGTYTTNAAGVILVDLEPGTYTVIETDNGDPYWYCDTEPQALTVKAGETVSVTFKNEWIGKAKIIKTLSNPEAGTVEGWTFVISDANGTEIGTYTTDADGTILVDLEPGTYTVTEVLEDNSLWECLSDNPQTVIVTAGQTSEVTFDNALRPGKIEVYKVDTRNEPLDGVEFLLEWSADGIAWAPVTYTDATVPKIGGCTTAGLIDGKLTTGENGYIVFTGLYPTLQYRLTETKTKDGYQLLKDAAYEGGLSTEEDLVASVKVVNAEIFALPKTGSKSLVMMPLSILLCLGVCAGAIMYLRKKEQ